MGVEFTRDGVDLLEVCDWQTLCPLDQTVSPEECRCDLVVVDVDGLDINLFACEKEPH